jgi:transposase
MPAVSEFTKAKIVTLHQRGMSYGQISTNLGLSKGTIHAIMRKWEDTGTVVRRPGSGRSRVSSGNRTRHLRTITEICASP